MNVNHAINLNLSAPAVPPRLKMAQNDSNSRTVVATLWDGAAPYEIPAGASAMVRFGKPDGTGGIYDESEDGRSVTATGNTVTAPVAAQMLSVAGSVIAQVEIYTAVASGAAASRLSSFCFVVDVEKSAYPDDTIISSDYYNVLSTAIQNALQSSTDAQTAAGDAEAWALGTRNGQDVPSSDPTHHNNAKYWAQNAAGVDLASARVTGTLPLSKGGTGATTAAAARTALGLGSLATKSSASLSGSDVTGTLPVSKGGTGVTTIAALLTALGISDHITSSGTTAKTGITWQWIKFNSGLAVCWGKTDMLTVDVTQQWGSMYVCAGGAGPYDLPFTFGSSTCFVSPASQEGDYWIATYYNADATKQTPGYQPVRPTSKAGLKFSLALFVIGTT